MTRRAKDALIGLVYLVVIVALIALSILIYNKAFTSYVTVSARTDSVGNALQPGSDVSVRGVPVGTVSGTSTDGGKAVVHLDLDPDKVHGLPANMTVRLLPKTLFGERYVSLVFPDRAEGTLRSGTVLQQDRSPTAVELGKLFDDLLPVLQAVRPAELSAALGELSLSLKGNGADIYTAMSTVNRFLQGFTPQVPQLTDDLAAFAQVAATYTQAAPDLIDALDSLSTVSATLVRQRSDYVSLLTSVTTMSNTIDTFVNTTKDQVIGLSSDSLPSLRIAARYASEFPCLSRALADFVPIANKAFGAGTKEPGAHVILHVVDPVKPYTTADRPVYNSTGGPQCPYTPATSLASTALAQIPGVAGANHLPLTATADAPGGIGPANSPQENELIAELVAPTSGLRPAQFPVWGSLLLGPALRGTQVSVR